MRFIEAKDAKYLDIKKSPSFEGLCRRLKILNV